MMTESQEALYIEEGAIAIIGMSGRFPGAKNISQFWSNLQAGIESIDFFSDEEILASGVDPALVKKPEYVKASGVLSDIDQFDAQFFDFSPKEAAITDPQHRLFTECAWEALENAGYAPQTYRGAIGVYAGVGMEGYLLNDFYAHQNLSDTGGAFQLLLGNDKDYLTTRVSYKLNLKGPSVNVQTACSTSLVAVHLGCQSLLNGECDMSIVGGASIRVPQKQGYLYQEGMIMSPDGHCRAFDAKAGGTVFGSGVGIVVLKRLEDALADRDCIHGIIKGSAINNDGSQKVGYTAPSREGQAAVIREAQGIAGIDPETITYIEAHGTGTVMGDPIEIAALTEVFRASTEKKGFCAIGSVKTNVGHLYAAAGVTSLIKTVLALKYKLIPPSLHFETPNPQIDFANSPFYVNSQLREWKTQLGTPRRAGVSSFGIGGTNAHVVLEEAPIRVKTESAIERPIHVLTLSAKTEKALEDLVSRYQEHLSDRGDLALADLCYTANTGRSHFDHRLAVIASKQEELAAKLIDYKAGRSVAGLFHKQQLNGSAGPKIAFLFTGQGSQYVNMGRQLYQTQAVFREAMDRCDRILRAELEKPLLEVIYPETKDDFGSSQGQGGTSNGGTPTLLDQTAYTQPALFAIEYALAKLWESWGIQPAAVMGHSVGEYVAACVAGVFSLEDGLKLIAARGRLMQQLPDGGQMVSLMASESRVRALIAPYAEKVTISAINGPESVVISGDSEAVRAIVTHLEAEGIKTKQLQVSHAFHSPLMEPMLASFEAVAKKVTYSKPITALISNVSGLQVGDEIGSATYWVRHIRKPVRFAESMKTLSGLGYELFLEIGPKPILLGMGRQCLSEDRGVWLPSVRPEKEEWQQMLESLGHLYVKGTKIDWLGFDKDYRQRSKVTLPTYPFQRQRYWVETKTRAPSRRESPDNLVPTHPLLGHKLSMAGSGQYFESLLSSNQQSYLRDHRVFNQTLFPTTGYLEMALAAGHHLFAQRSSFIIEEMLIVRGLILPSEDSIRVQTIIGQQTDETYSFEIFSLTSSAGPSEEPQWQLHSQGIMRKSAMRDSAGGKSLASYQASCSVRCDVESHYYHCRQRQIDYGSSFCGLQQLWRGTDKALGQLQLPSVLVGEISDYWMHPALLDAALQVLAAVNTDSQSTTYLPVAVERFEVYSRPGLELWALGEWQSGASQLTAKVTLMDGAGEVIAQLEGLRLQAVTPEALLVRKPDVWRDWLYEVSWRSQARFGHLEAPEFIPTPAEIAARLQPEVQKLLVDNQKLDHYISELVPQLEQVSLTFILQALTKLGWSYQVGESIDLAGVAQRLGVVPQHQRLLARLLQILSSEGILKPHQDRWQVLQPLPMPDDPTLQNRPDLEQQASWQLLYRCGSRLGAVLRGAVDPVQLVFPAGDTSTATKLYQDSPGAQVFNKLVQQVAIAAVAGAPQQRGLRILEIGAGTGGTTSYLLPHLPEHQTQYCFTDVGVLFIQKAQDRFGDYNFVEYQTLDIEQDPSQQGFEPHCQDVVIAANVLHATQNLRQTLANVRQLLAPGGVLVILEGTHRQRWVDLIFGLLEGWWRFADVELRSDYPLLDRMQWQQVLHECGFTSVAVLPGTEAGDDLGQAVIVAQVGGSSSSQLSNSRGWLILADSQGVAQQVAERLRGQKEVCTLVKIGQRTQLEESEVLSLEPDDAEGYQQLLSVVKERMPFVQGVIHCWGLDGPAPLQMDSMALEVASRLGCGTVLSLVQALVASGGEASPRLWIVTRGAQPAAGKGQVNLSGVSQSSLWGMEKVITQEHPELRCTCIDLDANASLSDQAASLWAEVWSADREDQVALRGSERYVSRLVSSWQLRISESQLSPSIQSGTYLITGGLGGLGLLVADWLVDRQVRHLVLVSRRGPSESAQVQLKALEERGAKVMVAIADVSDYEAMADVIHSIGQSHPPLRGIIHAAGVLDDGTLQQLSWQQFATVMGPKVQGAWNLHTLTQSEPIEFFVLFSSAASMLGSPGQANHSAANAFLDGLAHYRQSLGLPGQSLNLGAVTQVGEAAERGADMRAQQQGMGAIAPQQVLKVLERLLHQREVAEVGLVPIDWSSGQLPWQWMEWQYLSDWTSGDRKATIEAASSEFVQQLRAASAQDRKKMLTAYARSHAARVLMLKDPRRVDINQPLFDLGLDSLMAVELKNKFEKTLNLTLSSSLLFNYPTVGALVDYLLEQLAPVESHTQTNFMSQESPDISANDDLSEAELEVLLMQKAEEILSRE